MISFMFATLGSIGFWALYFMVSVFVTVITLKIVDKDAFDYVVLKKKGIDLKSIRAVKCVLLTLAIFLFWPFASMFVVVYYGGIKLLWPVFCKILGKANEIIPTVTFGAEKEKKE